VVLRAQKTTDLYRFFDLHVGISSDEPAFPALFARMFPRFRIEAPGEAHGPKALLEVTARPGPDKKGPHIRCDRKNFRLAPPPWLLGHAFSLAVSHIFDQVASHFLIHGGAVESSSGGIILSGPSSTGKTTLVLELVRRGLGYLSDDVAPLEHESRLLAPFPKSAAVREETLALLDLDPHIGFPSPLGRGFGAKGFLDIGDLPGARIGAPCPVRFVLFLQGGGRKAGNAAGAGAKQEEDHFIDIGLLDGSSPILEKINALPGARLISSHHDEGIEVVRFRLNAVARLTRTVLDLCREHRGDILYAERSKIARPDFDRKPEAQELSPSEGVVELLRDMKNRSDGGRLLADYSASLPRLYLDLADALKEASFFRLAPGELVQTAERICTLTSK